MLMVVMALSGCSAAGQPNPMMVPKAPPPPQNTNGYVWLMWTPGDPPITTLSNLTTRTSVPVGTANNYQWQLPLGTTNVFQAFNQEGTNFGFSNLATGISQIVEYKSSIRVHTFMVSMAVQPGRTNTIYTSTNLLTWQPLWSMVPTNSGYQFVWTNDNAARWFRTTTQ